MSSTCTGVSPFRSSSTVRGLVIFAGKNGVVWERMLGVQIEEERSRCRTVAMSAGRGGVR